MVRPAHPEPQPVIVTVDDRCGANQPSCDPDVRGGAEYGWSACVHTARACGIYEAFDAREAIQAVLRTIAHQGGSVLPNEGVLVARGMAVWTVADARAADPSPYPYVLFVEPTLRNEMDFSMQDLRGVAFVVRKLPGAGTPLGHLAKSLSDHGVRTGFFESVGGTDVEAASVHRALGWLRAGDIELPCSVDHPLRVYRGAHVACASLAP